MYDLKELICYNLQPSELLAMVCTCKGFKNILDESINPSAVEIWRNSRIRFTAFKDREPPSGISQQGFARLLTFEKGCQSCKTKEKPSDSIDSRALEFIVPVTPSIDIPEPPHYWIDHVQNTIAFLMNADDDNKRCALNSLREDAEEKYEEVQNYGQWMFNLRLIYLGLFSRFHYEIGIDKATFLKMQGDSQYEKLKIEIKNNPFLVHDNQQDYKDKLSEIAEKVNYNITPTQVPNKNTIASQKIIIKWLKELTYASEDGDGVICIRERLYKYLPLCPSFITPIIPPDGHFPTQFLSALRNEAKNLEEDKVVPPPDFLEVGGALRRLREKPVFECNICNELFPTGFKTVSQHIRNFHKLDNSPFHLLFLAKVNHNAALEYLVSAFFR
ncbi:22042_t:CDS:2 [Dentiscutata erythropus]|uniref:22042_t:CDS:1 n=1 Tax=Dentiscutata erythropus TaxID=1348616 RepID=A0A9N9B222_9GLOM|nr:22042_t:CDS:2 [Dentiscutata erythropus]